MNNIAKKIITGLIAMILSFEIVSILMGYLLQPEYALVQYIVSLLPLLLSFSLYLPFKELNYKIDQTLFTATIAILLLNVMNVIWIHNWGIYICAVNFTLAALSMLLFWLKEDIITLKEQNNI